MHRTFVGILGFVAACGPSSASSSFGPPRPPRAETCDLTLVSLGDVQPGGRYAQDYENVGVVQVAAGVGAQPTDDDVKKEVRPKACALGGELVVPVGSHTAQNGFGADVAQSMAFFVYAKKSKQAPTRY